MKKILLLFAIITGCFSTFAQNKPAYEITANGLNGVTVVFHSGKIETTDVKTDKGFFSRVTMANDNYSNATEVGKPELPVLVKLIEIPICNDLALTVNPLSDYTEYDAAELGIHHPVFPAQPSYSKSYEGPVELIKDEVTYNSNQFYTPITLGRIEKVGIRRNVNMAALYFSPVMYNPVTQKFRVYKTVQFEVHYRQADIPATYQMKSLHNNGIFLGAQNQVINPVEPLQKDAITAAPIKYLIVSHALFRGQLDSFVAWKKRKGFLVELAYTDDAGVGATAAAIKNFIKAHYDNATPENPAPTYVLLVGDVQQIPSFNGNGHVTDLPYMCWTAGDELPDCYYGRFSAQSVIQLTPQIEKTLMYEQYTMPSTAYLNNAVLVAGTAGGGLNDNQKKANGQMNYLSENYVNMAQGYAHAYYHQYNCSSQAVTIRSELGQGTGFANYTAHCSSAGWTDPQFSTSQISDMQNQNKYGLMIGNCCQSSKFEESECFAEKLLRVANKGAVGYIGGSDLTYWTEDYMWTVGTRSTFGEHPVYDATHLGAYDRLFHTHNEPYSEWFVTNGAIIAAGNMAVEASTSDLKSYYWEIYHLMGDPSIMTYLTEPKPLTISVNQTVRTGETSLDIHTVPYAYVALTGNNGATLYAAGFTDNAGNITLNFESLIPGSYELATWAQNYIISFTPITVTTPTSSYVIASVMNCINGTNTKYNSTAELVATLNNVGVADANAVAVKITSLSPMLTVLNDTLVVGAIAVNNQLTTQPFQIQIGAWPEDGQLVSIKMTVYFDGQSTSRITNLALKAPKFTTELFSISDIGNANNIIEAGEDVLITVNNKNIGHADANEIYAAMISHYCHATVANTLYSGLSIDSANELHTQFTVHIDSNVANGTIIPLHYKIRKGMYQALETFMIQVGKTVETFESQNFTTYNWVNGSQPWQITTTEVYEGNAAARSKINLGHSQNSTLQITVTLAVAGEISYARKVSSETNYDFFSFAIDGTEMESLSGEIAWGVVSFPVSAGTHTLKFSYQKDYSESVGSDCAWIDNIMIPIGNILAPEDCYTDFPPMSIEATTANTDSKIKLYPNPAVSAVTLSAEGTAIRQWELWDATGKIVKRSGKIDENSIEINISTLTNGLYAVKIMDNNQHITVKKFIKQ